MHIFDWKKYFYVLVITSLIFFTAIYLAGYFNDKKLDEVKSIEDKIAIDLLSSETEYSLLQESSCKNLGTPVLSQELGSLAEKLSYAEGQLGEKNADVMS